MPKVVVDITMSLDGFVAGPNATLEEPLGQGGERLHEWIVGTASWRERHGMTGGETGPEDELHAALLATTGAHVMGRKMFSGGEGPWENDPKADGWWGDDPPFHGPVFVLTHHARPPEPKQGGTTYTFVTDGIEAALEQARAASGERDVLVAGGGNVVQQFLRAGFVDELHLHVAPILLGGGVRLFDDSGGEAIELELVDVVAGSEATHLTYRPARA